MTGSELTPGVAHQVRVLLVDDDDLVLQALQEQLEGLGFEVIAAKDGEEALRLARARPPDFVLSDTNMPGLSGLELLARFQGDSALCKAPFFLMSGDSAVERRSLGAGANGFFMKPISIAEVRRGLLQVQLKAGDGSSHAVGVLHSRLGAALESLTEAASVAGLPGELQSSLASVLADVARLHGVTEWLHNGLANLSSDAHQALPESKPDADAP